MMNTARRTPYSPAIDAMIDTFDGGDPWGSAMGMAFALADVCEAVGLTVARDTLDYRPSPYVATPDLDTLAGAGEEDDVTYEAQCLASAYVAGTVTDDDLVRGARVLGRYLSLCERAGRSY